MVSRKINVGPVSLGAIAAMVVGGSAVMWGGLELFGGGPAPSYAKASSDPSLPRLEGSLLTLNRTEGTVSLISLTDGETVRKLSIGPGHREIAISRSGLRAVSYYDGKVAGEGDALTVVNVVKLNLRRRLPLGEYGGAHSAVWIDNDRVAFVSDAKHAVATMSTVTGKVQAVLPLGAGTGQRLALSKDGRKLYVTAPEARTLTVIDLAHGNRTRTLRGLPACDSIALSTDGSTLWLGSRRDQTVTAVDTQEFRLMNSAPTPRPVTGLTATPDSDTLVAAYEESGVIATLDAWTKQETHRITAGAGTPDIFVHPTGRCAYVTESTTGQIAVIDLEKPRVVARVASGEGVNDLEYTPYQPTRS